MKKILLLGPSISKSKGGMRDVIKNILEIETKYIVNDFPTYRDGNIIIRLVFCVISFLKFKRIYKKYDLFHIHVASSTSFYRKSLYIKFLNKKNKKIIVHIHSGYFISFCESGGRKRKKKIAKVLKYSSEIITLSQKFKDYCSNELGLNNVSCIYNAVDIEKYNVTENNKNKKSFAFIGRIESLKGIYELVSAINQLIKEGHDLKLFIAGTGTEFDNIANYIHSNDLENNVFMLGWLDLKQKRDLLSKICTLILPSYYEALPVTIIEAMCSGKNIICTDVGALNEFLIDGINCKFIKTKDTESLKESIKNVLQSVTDYNKIGQLNRRIAEKLFDNRNWIREIDNLYSKVLENE